MKLLIIRETADAEMPAVHGPDDLVAWWRKTLGDLAEEHFYTVFLDSKHKVLGHFLAAKGTMNAAIVHPREVFRAAICAGACAIVMMHNHPSGNESVSEEDHRMTVRMENAGELLGVNVLDHIVLGEAGYISMREQGLMMPRSGL